MRKAGVRGGASQTQAATLVLGGEADPIHFLDSTAPLTYAKELSDTGFKLANREIVRLDAQCKRTSVVALCYCQVCRKFAESAAVAHDWARRWPRPLRGLLWTFCKFSNETQC